MWQVSDCQSDYIPWGDFVPGSNKKKISLTTKHDIMSDFSSSINYFYFHTSVS